MGRVLIFGEFSGRIREEFRKLGHNAWSCDLLDSEIQGNHLKCDGRTILRDGWDLMIGHPACTFTAVSGARWFKDRLNEQDAAVGFFVRLWNAPILRIALEHPISIISTWFRKPDQIIQPWQFGEPETKATCLFLKNLPVLKPTEIVVGRNHSVWKEPPSPDRWKNRSRTFSGIAKAMAQQWGHLI